MCAMTTEARSQAATEEAREKVAAWAEQLAHRLQQAHDAPAEVETPAEALIPGAIAALWALVDEAVTQATVALVQAGLSERIQTFCTDQEYQLSRKPQKFGRE